MKLNKKRIALVTFILIILTFSGVWAPLVEPELDDRTFKDLEAASTGNMSAVITGPSGEEIEGDPDLPLTTGRIANPNTTTEVEPTGIDDDEFGRTIIQGSPTPIPGIPGIEHEDIGIAEQEEPPEGYEYDDLGRLVSKTDPATREVNKRQTIKSADLFVEKTGGGVVIKGSKIKENSAQFGQEHDEWIELLSLQATTEEELQAYIVAKTYNDKNIEEVTFNFQKITMDYRFPAKLFGIIDIDYTYHAEVDELGRIKTRLPWWLFLTRNNADDVTFELERQLSRTGDDAQLANMDLQNALQKQQQTIQTMSNVMKTMHDTAIAVIRKIG